MSTPLPDASGNRASPVARTASPSSVAVVGGGQMGSGIVQALLTAGAAVSLVESVDPDGALHRVRTGLEGAAQRGKLTEDVSVALDRLSLQTSVAALPADTSVVIEAVPEDVTLKVEVLRAAEASCAPDTLLATNTSSLSLTELAASLDRPGRFLGLHFFNPVPASRLIEVVVTSETTDEAVVAATEWVQRLGKTGIVVRDSPGFASSRLGVLLGLEAIRMLEEGVADAASIDTAMELGYRHPMGPLRSTDLVGLDVRLAIAQHLHATLGERFAPPRLLLDKVAAGELGRKSGQGFYAYD